MYEKLMTIQRYVAYEERDLIEIPYAEMVKERMLI